MPHVEHVDSLKWRTSKRSQDKALLSYAYPVHGSAREVNCLGADVQVVSCCRYLVFHPFNEQLIVVYISLDLF